MTLFRITRQYPRSQQGAALMIMLIILVLGSVAFLVNALSSSALNNARQEKTSAALAQAKEALVAYAISSENLNGGASPARPGNFPCPDTDAPSASNANYGVAESSCTSGSIGRLPWKTLGLPELLDGNGEPLWYALSVNFQSGANRINSDTRGTLLVYDRDGTTLLTPSGSEGVAIIFAPDSIVSNQQRNSTTDKTTASNYLEAMNGQNNYTVNGPFIAGDKNDTFNDRLMIIRTRDFMPAIEKRVAKELQSILANYYADNNFYPYPASFSNCKDNSTCDSVDTICRGRFPYNAKPTDWGNQPNYSLPTAPGGSAWFVNNRWYRVIYYSVGTNYLDSTPSGCSPNITVSGSAQRGLFFMPGTPLGSITRSYSNNNLSWYLEDTENKNMNDSYVSPTATSNDQLYILQ